MAIKLKCAADSEAEVRLPPPQLSVPRASGVYLANFLPYGDTGWGNRMPRAGAVR